jgi:hypothetical protein
MNRKVLNFSLIIIVGIYVLTFIYFKQQISKNIKQQNIFSDSLECITNKYFDLDRNVKIGFQNECIRFQPNIQLKDENGKYILLSSLVKKGKKLIFRFSETSCCSCLDQLKMILNSNRYNLKNEIIYISDYSDTKRITFFRTLLNINCCIYSINDLGLPIEKEKIPYLFILDEDMISKLFFIPTYGNQKLTENYMNNINSSLKNKKK